MQTGLLRKIIHISADMTPNVRFGLAQARAGVEVTNEILVPGIMTYEEYLYFQSEWDEVLKTIGLGGCFYEGAEVLMYPPQWLNHSAVLADLYAKRKRIRFAKSMGVDSGEGTSHTAWCIIDEYGIIDMVSYRTPDTSVIVPRTINLINHYKIPPEMVCFDAGGGGKQHAHLLRKKGYNVRIIGFGEKMSLRPKSGMQQVADRRNVVEDRQVYINRRAEMYDLLRQWIDPSNERELITNDIVNQKIIKGFGIPRTMTKLRKELAPIPLLRDEEGRLYMLPKDIKHKEPENPLEKEANKKTLIGLIGHSPDDADALVLAVFAMANKVKKVVVGAMANKK